MEIISVVKILLPSTVAFFLGLAITPILTHFLYKHKMWRKKRKIKDTTGRIAVITGKLQSQKNETNVPRMGGIIIWLSVTLTIFGFWLLSKIFPSSISEKLNFLSRNQTWLPLFTLVSASLVGLIDDFLVVRGTGKYISGGLSLRTRILIVLLIGAIGGWWFFTKLGMNGIYIPFVGEIMVGIFFVPIFMLVMLALFSGGVIDGIDGLAGGVMATPFLGFAGIAFFQNQIDLAAFCVVVAGSILAFLWFNIPPARFYMSETGMLGLTTTLTVIAFLTNAVFVLPIIAFPLFVSSGSDIIQLLSKRFRNGKKVFLVAPIHHHFEALGWPPYKVTMRFWILGAIFAILGMVIALIS